MLRRFAILLLVLSGPAAAQDEPLTEPQAARAPQVEMTTPTFEMFRMVPGQLEAFVESMALYDQVSIAGGQPPTQLFLHSGGEGWDLLLYKPARPKPTAAQEAAMARKIKELGLATGAIYFLQVRERMADHIHFEASGPTTASEWLAELNRQRAEAEE
jgi:hypothetical protein